jgi:hypothetical protein
VGYKIVQQSNNRQHDAYELVVDTPEDLKTLPNYIGAGSMVFVLKNEQGVVDVRIKSPSGEWVVL